MIDPQPPRVPTALVLAAVLAALVGAAPPARAGEKRFGYVYEPQTLAPGAVELEQWVTSRLGKASGLFAQLDLRTEIEVGIVENLQTALYLNVKNLRVADARSGHRSGGFLEEDGETRFTELELEGFSNEWIFKISDPLADPVGFAVYFEWGTNGQELELEEKLILAKQVGPFTLAANLIFEQEWRSNVEDESPRDAIFGATLGISWKVFDTGLSLAAELRTEHVLERFEHYAHSVLSVGPTVHYQTGRWWVTLTALPQVASQRPSYKGYDYDAYEALEVRIIMGVDF